MLLFLTMLDSDEDQSKFVQLYHKYRYFLWYLARERLQDDHLAEDAVQETFLALPRHMDKVGSVESAATRNFLATIVKNKATDLLRKRQKIMEDEETSQKQEAEVSGEDLLNQYLAQESYERILHAIQKLDEIYRAVFEYKYLHELSDREIADLLGVTLKVVNVRIFRARKKLQNLLREECGSNEQTKSGQSR